MRTTINLIDEVTGEENSKLAKEMTEYYDSDEICKSVYVRLRAKEMTRDYSHGYGLSLIIAFCGFYGIWGNLFFL